MRATAVLTSIVLWLAAGVAVAAAADGRIVFQATARKAEQLFTIQPDGSNLTQLTNLRRFYSPVVPAWAPDGATIAFSVSTPGGYGLATIPAAGGRPTVLPLEGGSSVDASYSPDGAQIAFERDGGTFKPRSHGIFLASSSGGAVRRLTRGPRAPIAQDFDPEWSPDGNTIAFARVNPDFEGAIFTIGVDGTGLRQLTPYRLDAGYPDWSPDGTRIVFNSYWNTPPHRHERVMTMRADGSGRTAITPAGENSYAPSWSPDGSRIVFTRYSAGLAEADLFTMTPRGTRSRRLTRMPEAFPTNADWGAAPSSP